MPTTKVFSRYALIGDDLDLKKNVTLDIEENGKISKISCENLGKIIDLSLGNQNNFIIPGLINSHTHIGDSFAKEKGFNRGLIETVAPPHGLKHKILKETPVEIKIEGIKNAIREMLSNGITCFIDFREGGVEGVNLLKESLKEFPIKCLILGRFSNLDEIEPVFKNANGIGLSSYKKASGSIIGILKQNKNKYDKIIASHCAEFKRDTHLIEDLFQDNIINVIIHGTKLTKDDLEKVKKKDISLVLCPCCNGYFGVGFPPINDILKLKIPISLGTDNLMVSNTDLFEEMRYLYRISRVLGNKENGLNLQAIELLKMVTIYAAKNFHLDKNIGSISEGKDADFFAIDLNEQNYYTHNLDFNTVFPLIVQRTKSENIKKVYIKGECVFERK